MRNKKYVDLYTSRFENQFDFLSYCESEQIKISKVDYNEVIANLRKKDLGTLTFYYFYTSSDPDSALTAQEYLSVLDQETHKLDYGKNDETVVALRKMLECKTVKEFTENYISYRRLLHVTANALYNKWKSDTSSGRTDESTIIRKRFLKNPLTPSERKYLRQNKDLNEKISNLLLFEDPNNRRREIVSLLNENSMMIQQVMEFLPCSEKSARAAIFKLIKEGTITSTREGIHCRLGLSDTGRKLYLEALELEELKIEKLHG